MSEWDDTVENENHGGRSFGKGRGFAPQRSSENSGSGTYRSNFGGERGRSNFGGVRVGRGRGDRSGGRFGSTDDDRDDGRRFSGDRRGGRSGGSWAHSNDDGDSWGRPADNGGSWVRSNNDGGSWGRPADNGGSWARSNDNDRRSFGGSRGRSNDDGDSWGGSNNDGGSWGRPVDNGGSWACSNDNDRRSFGGSRGRSNDDGGSWARSNDNDRRSFGGNHGRSNDDGGSWGRSNDDDDDDRRPHDDGFSRRGGGGSTEDDDRDNNDFEKDGEPVEKPKPVTYVPEERTDDQLFAETGIQKGINFDDYENIKVNVTGIDIPQSIHSFQEAEFRGLIIKNLGKCGYGKPTPIQKHAVPIIMAGRDLMATAQTGSGKTAAFLLPIIQRLLDKSADSLGGSCVSPQALILSPTRELAIQIHENARVYTAGSGLKVRIIYGGVQVRHHSSQLSRGCHILIATPGRLKDFMNRGLLKFDDVQFVVLDEADRMLDMGFIGDIKEVMNHHTMTPQEFRQTLMFSATFSGDIQRLAGVFLRRDYLFVAVGIVGGACKDVEQNFVPVEAREKKLKIISLLEEQEDTFGTLLFVEQKRMVDFLASYISEKGFKATSIHGDRLQSQREEALKDFKNRKMALLVATNVAARGLDIRGVTHVINYDLPREIDEYVHRIGRTGRLGNKGKATSFYDSSRDSALANNLVRILKEPLVTPKRPSGVRVKANQTVPDFLEQDATGMGDYDTGAFGGHDYRGNDGFKSDGNQPVAVADLEEW